ncbi:MAG: hypothetical protein HOE61_02675, partial [Candidatus Marinimicrobia bacterium]|nr:hypothetical protein [Candidatus Neomarinimicrobiota bacterium]
AQFWTHSFESSGGYTASVTEFSDGAEDYWGRIDITNRQMTDGTSIATQTLASGDNYFWLTYDIPSGATVDNVVDGECTSVTVDGTARTPSVTAPSGNRTITDLVAQNNALDFDGSNGYVDLGSPTDLDNLGQGSYTIEAWIKTSNTNTRQTIIGNYDGTPAYVLELYSTGNLRFYVNNTGYNSSAEVDDGLWHHVAGVRDYNNDILLYVDGVEIYSYGSDPEGSFTVTHNTMIGRNPSGSYDLHFDGLIDDVRIWDDVRTQAELQEYMCEDVSSESNLLAYYRMTDGSGTSLTDNSSNSNTGTLNNMDNSDWVTDYLIPSGNGTSGTEYQIQTLNHLWWLSQNSGKWDKLFEQIADIDMTVTQNWDSNAGFTPIGNLSTNFTGTYDGDDHTIDGLTINTSSADYIGLFGYIDHSAISNIGLTNVNITADDFVGGLVGRSDSSAISNSYSTGAVTGHDYVGGLVGDNDLSSTINNSYSIAVVIGNRNYSGGLVGFNRNSSTINNSYSTGTVTGDYFGGGLLGYNDGSTISNSYSTSVVIGTGYVGGLVGCNNNNNATISNSYSTGAVTGANNFGGLVGYNSTIVTNSFYDQTTSGQSDTGKGTPKTTAQMKTLSTFTNWDFSNIWDISTNTYPFLNTASHVVIDGNDGFRMMSSPVAGQIYSDLLSELWTQGMTGADETSGTANVWTLDVANQSWVA